MVIPAGHDFRAVPKITQIHACEYDLANARLTDFPGIVHYLIDAIAATLTPRLGDGTERAIVITTVLDFEKRTRTITERESVMEGGKFADLGGVNHPFGFGAVQLIDVVEHLEFFTRSEDQIDSFHFRDFFGFELGVATSHHYPGIWILSQNPPHKFTAFAVRKISHRTRV